MRLSDYQEKPGYFKRLKDALQITKDDFGRKIEQLIGADCSPITEEQLEELENVLISCDIGIRTTLEISKKIRNETRGKHFLTSHEIKRMIRQDVLGTLKQLDDQRVETNPESFLRVPRVIFVVGVNGAGKTTTIGKLAYRFKKDGKIVLMCASDTFRAAAIEQLEIWAERTNNEVVRQEAGADPAAVLFDAIAACKARGKDILVVDTAGLLHTKDNLMQQLEKMKRVAGREVEGAPHEVYLILDANTGQNGLVQAREFLNRVGVTGIIVTKLDGTAKGGIVVVIAQELDIPIRYLGVGEKVEDLLPFSPEAFVDSLFPENT